MMILTSEVVPNRLGAMIGAQDSFFVYLGHFDDQ